MTYTLQGCRIRGGQAGAFFQINWPYLNFGGGGILSPPRYYFPLPDFQTFLHPFTELDKRGLSCWVILWQEKTRPDVRIKRLIKCQNRHNEYKMKYVAGIVMLEKLTNCKFWKILASISLALKLDVIVKGWNIPINFECNDGKICSTIRQPFHCRHFPFQ